ncbi:MAG: DUF362 domain-containing protein [Spirochaetaceae bacterium]|jgi:uncharacterized protein (DUF362 family)|nr:DUF362 domain-containing protein [Spirochaetaceae bacterium]
MKNKSVSKVLQSFVCGAVMLAGMLAMPVYAKSAVVNVVENTDGTDNGVRLLLSALKDVPFYRISEIGLIGTQDVVLIKINSLWAERGGTNTDLLKAVIEYIIRHPAGFEGEIIVADNGQGMFGSEGKGGRLDWASPNSSDRKQSAQMVVDYFAAQGYRVSGVSWDKLTRRKTAEFLSGDMADGFVVEPGVKPTGIQISYPKFSTSYGTHVSFKQGIWDAESKSYNKQKLKLINIPVLKSHTQYQVAGAVSAYMGVPSNALTDMSPNKSVGAGGLGTLMANTRFPDLTILDMIYICPVRGPPSSYSNAVQKNMIAASTDPFALDVWAVKNVLIPAAELLDSKRAKQMDPRSIEQGSFGYWLTRSAEEVQRGGFQAAIDENEISVNKIQ